MNPLETPIANQSVHYLQLLKTLLLTQGMDIVQHVGFAIAIWLVGRFAIGMAVRAVGAGLARNKTDPTIKGYIESIVSISLTFLLVIAILRVLGIETTSFAALIAMVGLAVATAWAGLLSNLVAGFFILILQPFRVGDHISGGGVVGKVHAIGLFATTIDTNDHVRIFVGNAKLFTDNIQNHSILTFVRVDYHVQIAPFDDADRVFNLIEQKVRALTGVKQFEVSLLEANADLFTFVVRPHCDPQDFWRLAREAKVAIIASFAEAELPTPKVFLMRTP